MLSIWVLNHNIVFHFELTPKVIRCHLVLSQKTAMPTKWGCTCV